jgi:pimeloyl-ACP methyl ester carboxylesterase
MPRVDIAGLPVHYQVAGAGEAVVLLHGGLSAADSWAAQQQALAVAGFRVWVPERRGHGQTPDTGDPFSYEAMAEETIGFLDALVGRAHLVGWSDGAVVAVLVALRRPDLLDRMVLIGQYFARSGEVPGGLGEHLARRRDDPPAVLRGSYDAVSPDGPGHFPVVFAKTVDMIASARDIPLAELTGICAPTLVVQGDRDEVRLDHSAAVAAALPHGRLAVLPGTHALPLEMPHVLNPLLIDFLRGGPRELDVVGLLEETG